MTDEESNVPWDPLLMDEANMKMSWDAARKTPYRTEGLVRVGERLEDEKKLRGDSSGN